MFPSPIKSSRSKPRPAKSCAIFTTSRRLAWISRSNAFLSPLAIASARAHSSEARQQRLILDCAEIRLKLIPIKSAGPGAFHRKSLLRSTAKWAASDSDVSAA